MPAAYFLFQILVHKNKKPENILSICVMGERESMLYFNYKTNILLFCA